MNGKPVLKLVAECADPEGRLRWLTRFGTIITDRIVAREELAAKIAVEVERRRAIDAVLNSSFCRNWGYECDAVLTLAFGENASGWSDGVWRTTDGYTIDGWDLDGFCREGFNRQGVFRNECGNGSSDTGTTTE